MIISNDEFISLFIATLQIRYWRENRDTNYLEDDLHFNGEDLKKFIYYNKRNQKYSEFLRCFNFVSDQNDCYSVELITAFNYAISKKIITTTVGDIYYISKSYVVGSLQYEWDVIELMESFIDDFNVYLKNSQEYIKNLDDHLAYHNVSIDRFSFNLRRSLKRKGGE